ncbi:MAG: hypothetical protein HY290_04085 [Planctomycetia bacterium]|nr:hypothetical protein [Planctomycetia bacterium]
MNCDDLITAMESDDAAEQQAARSHAATCPNCAATLAALDKIKATLAVHEPLPSAARAAWERASRVSVSEPARRRWTPALAAIATLAAACIVVFVFVVSQPRNSTFTQWKGPSSDSEPGVEFDSSSELTRLTAAVEALDGRLVALAENAERLDVEREVAQTLKQYSRW